MRLSIVPGDPGYPMPEEFTRLVHYSAVYLDGVRQKHAVTADEEAGYVVRYRVGEDGNLVLLPGDTPGELPTETVYGKVEIKKVE